MMKLVRKDLKLFFGNKRDMALTFALPIIIITLFALAFGNMGDGHGSGNNVPGLVQSVAGAAVMMLLFSVASIGGSLLEEKKEGMLKKLLCAPIQPNHILFGKMVFANIVSVIQLTLVFVYAKAVFNLDIFPHIPSLALMIIATSYACSSFGIFLASFARSQQQVQSVSTIIILVMSAIGGSMMPEFIMPEFMQKIAVFSVNYWGMQGFFDIFWRALPITDFVFLSRVLVLIAIGTLLNWTAFLLFRKNILKIA